MSTCPTCSHPNYQHYLGRCGPVVVSEAPGPCRCEWIPPYESQATTIHSVLTRNHLTATDVEMLRLILHSHPYTLMVVLALCGLAEAIHNVGTPREAVDAQRMTDLRVILAELRRL